MNKITQSTIPLVSYRVNILPFTSSQKRNILYKVFPIQSRHGYVYHKLRVYPYRLYDTYLDFLKGVCNISFTITCTTCHKRIIHKHWTEFPCKNIEHWLNFSLMEPLPEGKCAIFCHVECKELFKLSPQLYLDIEAD